MKISFDLLGIHHAEALLPIWSDPNVIRFTSLRGIKSKKEAQDKIHRWLRYSFGKIGPYVVKKEDSLVGVVAGFSPHGHSEISEIFFHISRDHWRKGIGSQALDHILKEGFLSLGLSEIQAQSVAKNYGSWKLLEKKGFKRTSTGKKAFRQELDIYSYRITRVDFLNPIHP